MTLPLHARPGHPTTPSPALPSSWAQAPAPGGSLPAAGGLLKDCK